MKEQDEIEQVLRTLDQFALSDTSRLKIMVSEEIKEGTMKKEYHHGRCDINSPWATGECI